MLFWQPPSCFSQWTPSSCVVDDMSYSYAEQFTMAEKARLFQDRRAEKLIMSSPDSSAHKSIGRGVITRFGTTFAETPSLLAISPRSHRTRP